MNEETNKETSDEQLAKETQQGQIDSFGFLVQRYQEKIQRYAKKFLFHYEDTRDLTQDVFLKAYANIQSFDSKRKFSPWLYRIAHNQFINVIKKKSKENLATFDFDIFLPHLASKEEPEKQIIQQESQAELERLLARLNPKYREALVLYYFEDLSYKEIADVLHIPVSTVGVRLKRAKQMLKKISIKNYGKSYQ